MEIRSLIKMGLFLIVLSALTNNAEIYAQQITFSYTGSVQYYTVPDDVKSLTIDMSGATGGSSVFSRGGYGGRVQCWLAVTPGNVLSIRIGGAGKNSYSIVPGGYNGGSQNTEGAASGGGASDIRVGGNELADRVVVSGGGGGATGYYKKDNSDRGGAGGGINSETGYCNGSNTNLMGGYGGSEIDGGYGASGDYYEGEAGTLGIGGAGTRYYFSGGGGGGYYGGGGGSMGGGGGGSSYANPSYTHSVVHTKGYNIEGNGHLVISFLILPVVSSIGGKKE